MHPRLTRLLLVSTMLVPIGMSAALGNPLDGKVKAGKADVSGEGTANVRVEQASKKAIIDWKSFDIGKGEKTKFVQPGKNAVTLNRVTGDLGKSTINGVLKANGNVFLVNPDGILFGKNAIIDVHSLLATTNDIANEDFMAGNYRFNRPGRPDASVVNLGRITAKNGGFASLVAPGVRNDGVITARLGNVALASANRFTLDFYGDQLITLSVDDEIAGEVLDAATGKPLKALVGNSGKISADGGTVALTAVAARKVVDAVINNKGVIEATSVGKRNGMIVLGGATAKSKPAGAPKQKVEVSGTLDVSGKGDGETGGKVQITGERIRVAAAIDASGKAGGGTVLIGGDVGGGNPGPDAVPIPKARPERDQIATATDIVILEESKINASALADGDGGKVIVWSDRSLDFGGRIRATGGSVGGDGGFVETSGLEKLSLTGLVNASSPHGRNGIWLLDPADLEIRDSTPYERALRKGMDVTIQASRRITLKDDIIIKGGNSDATLKLTAPFIYHHEGVTVLSESGKLNITYIGKDVWFGRGRKGDEATIVTNGGIITLDGSNFVGINGLIDAGYGSILIEAENIDRRNIDYGIWLFAGSTLEAGSITLESPVKRIDKGVRLIEIRSADYATQQINDWSFDWRTANSTPAVSSASWFSERNELGLEYALSNDVFQSELENFAIKIAALQQSGPAGEFTANLVIKTRELISAKDRFQGGDYLEATRIAGTVFLEVIVEVFGPSVLKYPLDIARVSAAFLTAYSYGFCCAVR